MKLIANLSVTCAGGVWSMMTVEVGLTLNDFVYGGASLVLVFLLTELANSFETPFFTLLVLSPTTSKTTLLLQKTNSVMSGGGGVFNIYIFIFFCPIPSPLTFQVGDELYLVFKGGDLSTVETQVGSFITEPNKRFFLITDQISEFSPHSPPRKPSIFVSTLWKEPPLRLVRTAHSRTLLAISQSGLTLHPTPSPCPPGYGGFRHGMGHGLQGVAQNQRRRYNQ